LAAARDVLGRTGVAYLDGHLDLSDGNTSPTGEAADMPLSVALGRGPAAWVEVCDGPSARIEDVVPIGYRDPDEVPTFDQIAPELGPSFRPVSKDEVVSEGPAAVGGRVASDLASRAGRFWMHLDVDILGEEEFPATDYLMPDGLDMDELVALMRPLAASPALIGVSIGCYNPEKDPNDVYGRALVDAFRATLAV
jgi:arginase